MTTSNSDLPALIIGAGIGGLATAIALQRAGFQVRVFERVLAHSLRRVHPISEALQSYQQKRLTRANMIAIRSRNIGAVAQWDHPFACWLRDHLLMLAPSRVLVKQLENVASYTFDTD